MKIKDEWKYFPNSVLVRFTMNDGESIYREFPLVTDEYMVDLSDTTTGKTFPNIFKPENAIEKVSEGTQHIQRNEILQVVINVYGHAFCLS